MADSITRGLATVALLKVNYDVGKDQLDMYTPFVLDTLTVFESDYFAAEELKESIYTRHRLTIPLDALRTVLNRLRKQGFVSREHARYLRHPEVPIEIDLPSLRQSIEREHVHVARRFTEFAAKHHLSVANDENALVLLFNFLEANEVTMLITPRDAVDDPVSQHGARESRVVALFVQDALTSDPILSEHLQRMLEGLVLQNALLLRDVDLSRRRFKDLEVFFDSGFIFRAVGLASPAYVTAARESLAALRATSAGVSVWTKTIEEMQRVLAAIEGLIGTTAGLRALYRTPLVRFLLSQRYTPSQVAQASVLLERDIRRLGFTVRSQPPRIPRYTLDEADLSRRLMRPDQTEVDSRIQHDVDAIAAVLTIRRDRLPYSIDNARAIFSTTSGLLVKNGTDWYRAQGQQGPPPLIHQAGLSNIAWLKRPEGAADLKRHELAALCVAALSPTKGMWKRFTQELRSLKDSGRVTSEEEVALLTTHFVDAKLAEVDDEDDVDAETVVDVIARFRESVAAESDRKVAEAVQAKGVELSAELEAVKATARDQEKAQRAAVERAARSEEERREIEIRVIGNARTIAGVVGACTYWGAAAVIAAAALLGAGLLSTSALWPRVLTVAVLVIATILNFVDLQTGLSVRHLRRQVEARVARRITLWWLGREN